MPSISVTLRHARSSLIRSLLKGERYQATMSRHTAEALCYAVSGQSPLSRRNSTICRRRLSRAASMTSSMTGSPSIAYTRPARQASKDAVAVAVAVAVVEHDVACSVRFKTRTPLVRESSQFLARRRGSVSPYRGVAVHNVWQALALEDVVDELGEIEQITLGAPTPIVIGGFDGQRIEAEVTDRVTLWFRPSARVKVWWLQRGPAA